MTYPPHYYTDDDPAFARRIMTDHSFAILVIDGLEATHLPLLFKPDGEHGTLYGHLSRSNPICTALEGTSALAIFSGPHGYVSAELYDDPSATVPTWNYASVQARGRLTPLSDAEVLPHLQDMARAYEAEDGWSPSDAEDYVARLRQGIIAFRMNIDSIRAFRKMSTNKRPAIRKRIIDAARACGEDAFADEMETLS